jgi:hypothetical protein
MFNTILNGMHITYISYTDFYWNILINLISRLVISNLIKIPCNNFIVIGSYALLNLWIMYVLYFCYFSVTSLENIHKLCRNPNLWHSNFM